MRLSKTVTKLRERVSALTQENTELKDQVTHLAFAGAVLADRLRKDDEAARLPDDVVRLLRS